MREARRAGPWESRGEVMHSNHSFPPIEPAILPTGNGGARGGRAGGSTRGQTFPYAPAARRTTPAAQTVAGTGPLAGVGAAGRGGGAGHLRRALAGGGVGAPVGRRTVLPPLCAGRPAGAQPRGPGR